jgi:hypothetical protein
MKQATLVGYPHDVMESRARAVENLLFEPGLTDTTAHALESVATPLLVVARRTPPADLSVTAPPGLPVDELAKLDQLPQQFQPLFRTPTVVVYRYLRMSNVLSSRRRTQNSNRMPISTLRHTTSAADNSRTAREPATAALRRLITCDRTSS